MTVDMNKIRLCHDTANNTLGLCRVGKNPDRILDGREATNEILRTFFDYMKQVIAKDKCLVVTDVTEGKKYIIEMQEENEQQARFNGFPI
jgi:sulfite reductase beta subunit-like hemoprotein